MLRHGWPLGKAEARVAKAERSLGNVKVKVIESKTRAWATKEVLGRAKDQASTMRE